MVGGGGRRLPNVLCAHSPQQPVPLSPMAFKKMSSRLPKKLKLSESWKQGKQKGKVGREKAKRLCLIFFRSLKTHSAFPKGLKFSLKAAVQ